MNKESLKPIKRLVESVTSDDTALQTAQGLMAQFVNESGKVSEERAFRDAIAAAIIAARTEGRLEGQQPDAL